MDFHGNQIQRHPETALRKSNKRRSVIIQDDQIKLGQQIELSAESNLFKTKSKVEINEV